jgi:hypothetical protein
LTVQVDLGADGINFENDEGQIFVDTVYNRSLVGHKITGTTKWEFDDSTTTNEPGDYHFEGVARSWAKADDSLSMAKPHGGKKKKGPASRGKSGKSKAARKKKKKSR